jgi:hypothetical protein
MGCSRLVIGEGSHGSNPQSCSVHPPDARYKGSSLDAVCPIFYICPTLFLNGGLHFDPLYHEIGKSHKHISPFSIKNSIRNVKKKYSKLVEK